MPIGNSSDGRFQTALSLRPFSIAALLVARAQRSTLRHASLEMEESFFKMEENMMEEEDYFKLRRRGINSLNLMLMS